MQQQLVEFITVKKLFRQSNKILLTVSGGIDSIVMLHLFLKLKINVAVAHCNFGLRGKESEADEQFVKHLCKKGGVPFYSVKFDTIGYVEDKGVSVQMAARALRYSWFEKLRKEIDFNFIATAHHQTDVTETLLINLLRGTGIAGLHGISAKKGKVIRPLLFATRSEIEQYSRENKLTFREDSSNAGDAYLRNKIRHWVLPELQKINPDFEKSFFETANKIAGAETVFNLAVEEKREKISKKTSSEIRFSIRELKKLNPLSVYLFEFLKIYNFNSGSCSDIENCLAKNSGKEFYSKSHRLLIDRDFIIICKLLAKEKKKRFTITASQRELKKPISLHLKKVELTSKFKLVKSKNVAQLDASKISFPLELRKWKTGDTFQPLGMKGRKKLSDFFIDNKLSIFDKEKIWLLCSGKKIAWVINQRMDDRFKITASTTKIIQVEYHED